MLSSFVVQMFSDAILRLPYFARISGEEGYSICLNYRGGVKHENYGELAHRINIPLGDYGLCLFLLN